jgi:phosphoesterase RecJ-like protein
MKNRKSILEDIKRAMLEAKHAVIGSHKNPEIDCIASSVVISLVFDSLHKKYTLYNPDPLPYNCGFLKNAHTFTRSLPKKYDLVVIVDCGEIERIGDAYKKITASGVTIINIDHHLTNTNFGHINYVLPQAAATGEVLYDIVKLFPKSLTQDMARSIFSSLIADTGSFRYSSTSEQTFRIAADMMKVGINSWEVSQQIFENQPLSRVKLIRMALDTISIDPSKKNRIYFCYESHD